MRFYIAIMFLLIACNPREKVDHDAVKEEMNEREVKVLSEGEILAAAQSAGQRIAEASQQALGAALAKAIREKGIPEAISYCNLNAIPIVDSLASIYKAEIKRVSFKTRNPGNKPDDIEKEILDAYQYTAGQNQTPGDNVQMLDQGQILYTRPIMIPNTLCLNCHGQPGKELTAETHELIRKLYPGDEAFGYAIGDLRGMWSIRMSRKEVVKSM